MLIRQRDNDDVKILLLFSSNDMITSEQVWNDTYEARNVVEIFLYNEISNNFRPNTLVIISHVNTKFICEF